MGKYMKKVKVTGDVAVMEVPHHSSLGVRTRARTLALQRLQMPCPLVAAALPEASSSYIQLRSRRLQKPPAPKPKALPCEEDPTPNSNPSPIYSHGGAGVVPVNSGSVVGSGSARCLSSKKEEAAASEASPENDAGLEVSFGENVLEVEARSRNARETTPCSLIRDSETIETPGSTTRPPNSTANRRTRSSVHRNIPTAREMEEFFSGPEQLQQKKFVEKYNFDPVNDKPLSGRYEWVKLDD